MLKALQDLARNLARLASMQGGYRNGFSRAGRSRPSGAGIETRHAKTLKAQTNKTDRNDARGIAQMMRINLLRPVHLKTLASQKRRALLTARKLLQEMAIAIENDIRGPLRNFGLKVGVASAVMFEKRILNSANSWKFCLIPGGSVSFREHLFVFRGRRGDLIKIIQHEGQGACLFSKRLERGRFLWPSPADGVITI